MIDVRSTIQNVARSSRRFAADYLRHPALVSSLLIAGLVLGFRQVGTLQTSELLAFDQMLRLRPDAGQDQRLLVVAVTEEDIRRQNRWPLSDEVLARLIAALRQNQPRVIGLDVYRDVPHPPGHTALLQQLQAPETVAITLLGDVEDARVPPPQGMPNDRVGFSDFVVDPDFVVRRNLLYATTATETFYSFSLRLSLRYLAFEGKRFQATAEDVRIGDTRFLPLDQSAGGYWGLDDRGYQVLLNYQTRQIARQVTLTQVLNGDIRPEWVKDKVVLIGTTAASAKDLFLTPYNLTDTKNPKTPGVWIHAQMVSQILSSVLDGRPLLWYWSEPGEVVWIWVWGFLGSFLAWRFRHPLLLGLATAGSIGSLFGLCFGLFLLSGWVPFVPSAIALIGSGAGVVVYRLLHDAFHDALTGLPNRALFTKQLQWVIARRRSRSTSPKNTSSIAVLLLGLDGFKAVNDSLGHRLGDQLLMDTAARLADCLHSRDWVARVGGDEFAILRQNVNDAQAVIELADHLLAQVTLPFQVGGQEVFSTASVGIVLDRPDSDYRAEDILRDAHTAMNQAKVAGKSRYKVFAKGMRVQVMTRLQLETDLRHALERQEFQLHYQPLVALASGKIAGFEALVRWQHPQRGMVSPVEFIPVAEEINLIIPLGQWIIREACQQLRSWQAQFPQQPPLLVSVNLSTKQFSQPDLVEQIEQTLQETGLDGRSLKLEITESMAMTDVESTIALLHRLKALDLQLSIDDFGTGYSSLSYLHRFPTDTIKVDRSFVSRMDYEREDTQIVQTIVMLGHNLKMDIVAEGVETAEQLERLRSLNCEYGQGYFFSKPLSAEAMEELLKRNPQW